MANVNSDAILTAVREVLTSNAGVLRKIASTTYRGGQYGGQTAASEAIRSLGKPTVEPSIGSIRRHPLSPPVIGSIGLYELDVTVRVVRYLGAQHAVDDTLRDDIKSLAANDADVIAQALTYPGNLRQTSAAVATGLVSGLLNYVGSSEPAIEISEDSARIVTTHEFSGTVSVTLATS